jgi:hypothetical protein
MRRQVLGVAFGSDNRSSKACATKISNQAICVDSARLAAIMVLIHGWRRGPERVSRHVQETMAARGDLAVACEAAGDRVIPPYARLMTCANT